jgi:glutathione S-transferase
MPKLVLYDFPPVPSPQKVAVALAEKGIECERVMVDLRAGDQHRAEYLKINPHGLVPTLLVDGTPIYESSAIIEYLEEIVPEPPLLPMEPLSRARARMIEESIDGNFASWLKFYGRNRRPAPPAEPDEVKLAECCRWVAWYNGWLDRELDGRTFFAGDRFSIADIAAICNIAFQINRLKIDVSAAHQRLLAWYERIIDRPSMSVLKR